MPITTARETTTAMMIDLVTSRDTGLLQLVDCGGPHFPFLQQLFPQSSSVEHDEFSQLSIHFISPSSPQHCFSQSMYVKVYRHCLASTTQTTTKSIHMAIKSLFILYRPNSVMILCEKREDMSFQFKNAKQFDYTRLRNPLAPQKFACYTVGVCHRNIMMHFRNAAERPIL